MDCLSEPSMPSTSKTTRLQNRSLATLDARTEVNVFSRPSASVRSKCRSKNWSEDTSELIGRGFSGRYCEVSLHEQCGTFPSMTTIELDCVLCICYNGLFTCDTQPIGLCRESLLFSCSSSDGDVHSLGRRSRVFQTRSVRLQRALATVQHRFKNIRSFEPMVLRNVSFDDQQLLTLSGYRIVLNHAISSHSSLFLVLLLQLTLVWSGAFSNRLSS